MIYYAVFSVGLALADGGKMHIGVALWLPNIIASLIAAILTRKITTERWQSVSEGVFNAIEAITAKLKARMGRA